MVRLPDEPSGASSENRDKKLQELEGLWWLRLKKKLQKKNTRMIAQLEEIAENNQLIEVEIYNGASQDVVFGKTLTLSTDRPGPDDPGKRVPADQVWNWGRAPAQMDQDDSEKVEVWEDEFGSSKPISLITATARNVSWHSKGNPNEKPSSSRLS